MVQKKSAAKPKTTTKSTSKAKAKTNARPTATTSSKTSKARTNSKTSTKTPNRTNTKKEKHTLISSKIRYEIKMLILIGFTVISVFSIHTNAVGYVGSLIRGLYYGLFASVAIVSPYFVMMLIFVNINPNLKEVKAKYNIAISSIFFAIILFYSTAVYDVSREALNISKVNVNSFNGFKEVYLSAIVGNGAGVFGTYISGVFISLLGKVGSYVIAFVLIMLGIILGTKVSLHDIWSVHKRVAIKTTNKAVEFAKTTGENLNNQRAINQAQATQNVCEETGEILSNKKKNFNVFDSDSYMPPSETKKSEHAEELVAKKDKTTKTTSSEENLVKAKLEEESKVEEKTTIKISSFDANNHSSNSSIEDATEQMRKIKETEALNVIQNADKSTSSNSEFTNTTNEKLPSSAKSSNEEKKENAKIDPAEASKVVSQLEKGTHETYENYIVPSIKLLKMNTSAPVTNKEEILAKAKLLEDTLGNFGVEAKVVEVAQGPAITMFELQPSPGVKVSKIVNLSDDIALSLAASQVRIIAPIPGKSAVGIEIPNKDTSMVMLRDVLDTKEFKDNDSKLTFALGKDISGNPILSDLSKMPHLLIAGATGSGKSVCVNTLICTILFNSNPDEVKFLMIDPKVVELNNYNGIPHLILPVVTDAKKASIALNWAVQEMTRRYQMFAETGVRDVNSYNIKAKKEGLEKLAKIVVIIDELADLMMVAPNQVEDAICRLAQMARAAGIHLIVATQRPSVDVITGLIKANIPSRIAFSVSSMTDSRTILDTGGAEKLLGKGDMLFSPVGSSKPHRVQGAFISDEEVEELVDFVKGQSKEVEYDDSILDSAVIESAASNESADEHLKAATEFVIQNGSASISMLQRKFRIGYNRAARLIDDMEERGIVGPSQGSKAREVLIDQSELEEI